MSRFIMSETESAPSLSISDAGNGSNVGLTPANAPDVEDIPAPASSNGKDDLRSSTDSDKPTPSNDGENSTKLIDPLDTTKSTANGEAAAVSSTESNAKNEEAQLDESAADPEHHIEEEEEAAGHLFACS